MSQLMMLTNSTTEPPTNLPQKLHISTKFWREKVNAYNFSQKFPCSNKQNHGSLIKMFQKVLKENSLSTLSSLFDHRFPWAHYENFNNISCKYCRRNQVLLFVERGWGLVKNNFNSLPKCSKFLDHLQRKGGWIATFPLFDEGNFWKTKKL